MIGTATVETGATVDAKSLERGGTKIKNSLEGTPRPDSRYSSPTSHS